jgi:sugar phosphate isomerase/epimerase
MSEAMQLLCSTGTFSRDPDYTDYQAVLAYGPGLEVDGFEVLFYAGWYAEVEHIAAEMRRSGLRFPAVHVEKSIGTLLGSSQPEKREQGIERFAANCRLGKLVGAGVLVLHLWGLPELDEQLERNLQGLEACLTLAEQSGLQLAVETIPGSQADPLSNVRRAVDQDERCAVALDTEFLGLYHQLETALNSDWLWQGNRMRHIHIKDFDGRPFTDDQRRRYLHPGEGYIDFVHLFNTLKQRGFAGNISLEASAIQRDGKVDLERLRASLTMLRGWMST